jgi:CBS domain-containing protein
MLRVREVMSKPVITVAPDTLVRDAALLLAEKDISGLPVVDAGKVIGIFSEADVLKSIKTTKKDLRLVFPSVSSLGIAFQEEVTQREILEAYDEIGHKPVKEVMSRDVVTIGPDSTLNEAIVRMVHKGISRLPVVDKDELIGIISRGDVIRGLAKDVSAKNH